jgi:hypothetical protein
MIHKSHSRSNGREVTVDMGREDVNDYDAHLHFMSIQLQSDFPANPCISSGS